MNPKDAAAHNMVVGMDALFLVDRLARETQLSVEARLAMLKEHAASWVEEIHQEWRCQV